MALALVQRPQGLDQQIVPQPAFLGLGDALVLQRLAVDEEVLPATFAVIAQRHVERGVPAHRHATVHRDHVLFGDAEIGRDLGDVLGLEVAILEGVDLVLHPAEVEEELLLRGGGAHFHERPAAQDIFLDRGADPPHRVGGEAEAPFRLELLHALHQADIAFGDQLGGGQPIAAIAHGDLRHEPEVRIDQLGRGISVLMLGPALGQHIFLFRRQNRKLLDLREIAVEASLTARCGDRRRDVSTCHGDLHTPWAPTGGLARPLPGTDGYTRSAPNSS